MTMRKTLTTALIALLLAVIPGAMALRAQAPSGPREGIVVHGHWVIDIREPDGRLVSHLDFENALEPTGGDLLSNILARRKTPGPWLIDLSNSLRSVYTAFPCVEYQGGFFGGTATAVGSPCVLYEPYNLNLDATGLVLSGVVRASGNGYIDHVATRLTSCDSTVLPSDCPLGNPSVPFSGTFVALQHVVVGQLISVTVTFTFGSGT